MVLDLFFKKKLILVEELTERVPEAEGSLGTEGVL
jgi:hypothetical protein